MAIKKGMDIAVEKVKAEIKSQSKPIETRDQIAQVAILSAHDDEMGGLIADIMDEVGRNGVISIEESKGMSYETEKVEGMEIDRGYLSPHFVTNPDRMITEIEDPYILITSEKISSASDLVPFLSAWTGT